MEFYFAPLEGITGYIYRNAYEKYFGGIAKYFAPFIAPGKKCLIPPKELRDIKIEHNDIEKLVPQILTNHAEAFVDTAKQLAEFGYNEVNLNLGCPSKTVTSKKKGAGFLEDIEELDRFLEEIFDKCPIAISIKTRIGIDSEYEFEDILKLYNKYPLAELIIHPRLLCDFYKNKPHMDVFMQAVVNSTNELCYNGNLFKPNDILSFEEKFSDISKLMLGRGLLANPFLLEDLENIRQNIIIQYNQTQRKEKLYLFHNEILNGCRKIFDGDTPVLYKMKELWSYMLVQFDNADTYGKKIRKARHIVEYESIVKELFSNISLAENGYF